MFLDRSIKESPEERREREIRELNIRINLLIKYEKQEIITKEQKAELEGYYAFPKNKHLASLKAKEILGTITKEQKAELQGYYEFPDDRYGAILVEKEILGSITERERKKLKLKYEHKAVSKSTNVFKIKE